MKKNQRGNSGSKNKHNEPVPKTKKRLAIVGDSIAKDWQRIKD